MSCELGTLFSNNIVTILVNNMAKIKVGAPAVSRYHQIEHFFVENDLPNLNDHDFPVPGYFLNVSGHMFLAPDEKINYSALNESNYVVESLTNSEPNFQNMTPDCVNCNLFTVLSHQTEVQWNVKMSPDDSRDAIKKNIDHFLPKDMTQGELFLSLGDNLTFDSIDRVLNATANLSQCKIFRFYKEDSDFLYKIFISNVQPTEAPLYIFNEGCGKKRFNFNIPEHELVTLIMHKKTYQMFELAPPVIKN